MEVSFYHVGNHQKCLPVKPAFPNIQVPAVNHFLHANLEYPCNVCGVCPLSLVTCVRCVKNRYYPYHYAPLVSDLAKHTGAIARLKAGGGRRDGGADSWAPPHGPVRPLVQLMSVLPPRRYSSQPTCTTLVVGPVAMTQLLLPVWSLSVR